MRWVQFSHGLRLEPIAKGPPEVLVVLLHDLGVETLTPIAARWASTVPTTAFVVLDGSEQRDLPLCDLGAPGDGETGADPTPLDVAAHDSTADIEAYAGERHETADAHRDDQHQRVMHFTQAKLDKRRALIDLFSLPRPWLAPCRGFSASITRFA